ncbi:MAG: response regulator [Rhodocyclales bacterium]|nr:response regulator [Rhodocyclales bacterium]
MSDITETPATLLLVDDEANILSSLRRLLRSTGHTIHTAESGAAGLAILEREAVDLVISDMRMPEMNGAQFLEQVRDRWPATTRILLTGYADVSSTIDAINRGEIFRYISKPWDDEPLKLTIRDALETHRLRNENARLLVLTRAQNEELAQLNAGLEQKVAARTAEVEQVNSFLKLANDRLKQNFLVSIKVFSGFMELRGGAMVGHSRRVADLARKLAVKLQVPVKDQQDIFIAALLHDIGKIGFSDALLARPVSRMSGDDLGVYRHHAAAGEAALMPLVELKEAAGIIRAHHERFDGQGFPDGLQAGFIPLGARILAVANDYDGLQIGTLADKHFPPDEAREALARSRGKRYDPQVLDAFFELIGGPVPEPVSEKAVTPAQLAPGMVLARDFFARDGVLLLAADYVLDPPLIRQIQLMAQRDGGGVTLYVRTDRH